MLLGELTGLAVKEGLAIEHGEKLGRLLLEPKGGPKPLRHPQVKGGKGVKGGTQRTIL